MFLTMTAAIATAQTVTVGPATPLDLDLTVPGAVYRIPLTDPEVRVSELVVYTEHESILLDRMLEEAWADGLGLDASSVEVEVLDRSELNLVFVADSPASDDRRAEVFCQTHIACYEVALIRFCVEDVRCYDDPS
ncbi:MAG: hypothetical protein ABMB14_24045 [Myxococcota bacterium]